MRFAHTPTRPARLRSLLLALGVVATFVGGQAFAAERGVSSTRFEQSASAKESYWQRLVLWIAPSKADDGDETDPYPIRADDGDETDPYPKKGD